MNTCSFFYCYLIIVAILEVGAFRYFGEEDLYEGSPCKTEHGESGFCKQIMECPARMEEIRQGKRGGNALGRCGFKGRIEIVCCANKINNKFNVRPADSACQANRVERVIPFIYWGLAAVEGEFPYMAVLGYDNTDGEVEGPVAYECGGSLISSKYILTAAHCISNINEKVPKWAKLGSVNIKSKESPMIPLDGWIAHPKYRRSQNYNDIALVSLEKPLSISETVKPVCLQTEPLQESSSNSNTSFMAIGFGATENEVRSDILLKSANLDLIATKKCNASYVDLGKLPRGIDNTIICARDIAHTSQISDACQGDSGGPLVMVNGNNHTVIGVTSFGQQCGTVVPSGYTAVHPYIDWIESIVWPEKTRS